MAESDFSSTASIQHLQRRAALQQQVRAFFDARGFWEVETPLLSADTVVDRYIEPIAVRDDSFPGASMWLQTSPEYGMKRLLASGADAIYQFAKCFRAGESGGQHNPEFTMLEWYRVGDDYDAGMQLLSDVAEAVFQRGPAERIRYREAFREQCGVDPYTASVSEMAGCAKRLRLSVATDFSNERDDWLDLLLTERVQPVLGADAPAILYDYPASQAALARIRDEEPPIAERFELFVSGVELANGYHELLDADVLRTRGEEINQLRVAEGKRALPVDSRLLDAMEAGLPACCGCALGFDRLVILALGVGSIDQVIAFPIDRA